MNMIWNITEAVVKMEIVLLLLEGKIENSGNAARKNYREKLKQYVKFSLCRQLVHTNKDRFYDSM